MSLKRYYTWLLACTFVLCAGGSLVADEAELLEQFDEPFGFADPDPYRGYQLPNTGYFFNFDQLYWSFSRPDVVEIGQPGLNPRVFDGYGYHHAANSMDTSWMGTDFTHGQRYEFGHQCHHWGWLISGFTLRSQTQQQAAGDVEVVFNDSFTTIPGNTSGLNNGQIGYLDTFLNAYPAQTGYQYPTLDNDLNWTLFTILGIPNQFKNGRYWDGDASGDVDPTNVADQLIPSEWDLGDLVRLSVVFDEVQVLHRQQMWSTEAMAKYRFDQLHNHGNFELMGGVRYINFKDRFRFQGWGGLFDDSVWDTTAINNLVGPQVAARWFKAYGRLQVGVETRFMAGFNFQAIRQYTRLASHAPDYVGSPIDVNGTLLNNVASLPAVGTVARTYTHGFDSTVFSPVGELRVNLGYNLTKAITLRAGWTGIIMGDIARGQSVVNYSMPGLGINPNNGSNKQDVFVQGYNLGVEVNY